MTSPKLSGKVAIVTADELVAQIGEERALAIKGNAGSLKDIDNIIKATVNKFGKIDILVPNAGMLPMTDLEHTTEEVFDQAFALNVKGPYFLSQKAVPHMPSGGHIILISSTLCHVSTILPSYLLYNSTKGSIEQMVRVMSKDLGTKGILVNAVGPGPTATELFYRGKTEQMVDAVASQSPMKRIGKPEDIAEAIGFLAGSSWVAGQTVLVNGAQASF